MKACFLILSVLTLQALAGCSMENSVASTRVVSPGLAPAIDPSIPTVTITAKRMTPAEKLAYDQSVNTQLIALKSVE